MARFTAQVEVHAPADAVWDLMVDWPAHGRWVPFTRVSVLTARPDGVGARFVGRSSLAVLGLGRLGFDDPMEVTEWAVPSRARPGRCTVRKLGRVVTGTASFDVVRIGPDASGPAARTRVIWQEDIEVAPVALTRLFAPLVAVAGRLAFTASLRAMARELAPVRT